MIPSPYTEYIKENWRKAKREIAFTKKVRAAEQMYESVVQSNKAVNISISKNNVTVQQINLTDQELAKVGKFLIQRYGGN